MLIQGRGVVPPMEPALSESLSKRRRGRHWRRGIQTLWTEVSWDIAHKLYLAGTSHDARATNFLITGRLELRRLVQQLCCPGVSWPHVAGMHDVKISVIFTIFADILQASLEHWPPRSKYYPLLQHRQTPRLPPKRHRDLQSQLPSFSTGLH